MKKSAEILGLPIISITEGRELGISKALLIDAKNGIVAALILEDEEWFRGVKVLPYNCVIAIGEDAVTVTSSENILQLNEASEYEQLLTANVKIINTKAITKAGSIQGIVTEIYVDENGKVAQCEITKTSGDIDEISAEQVSIFGKQVTIIDSDVPHRAPVQPQLAVQPAPQVEQKPAAPAPQPEKPAPEPPKEEESPAKAVTEPTKEEPQPPTQAAPKPPVDKAAEERHRRFLLGKKASRRITTENGIVIVEAGGDITEEVLQKAKLANKFVELSMNIQ